MGLITKLSKGLGQAAGEIIMAPLDAVEAAIDVLTDDIEMKDHPGGHKPTKKTKARKPKK